MKRKRVLTILFLFLTGYALMAASPYAVINYAEGTSFSLMRDGKTSKISVDAPEVLGMELKSGDILQTAASTFLEITINAISATVQVAENTSFKCAVDSSGEKVTGELYYGRVRAKVTKLTGASTFHISTPSLVAGVRGTNFGCDVIAVRSQPSAASAGASGSSGAASAGSASSGGSSATGSMVITNRVFCFEGSVAVDDASKAVPETILISPDEMVEKDVVQQQTAVQPLQKKALDPEIKVFWDDHPIAATRAPAREKDEDYLVVDHKWPEGRDEKKGISRGALPAIVAVTLGVIGTTCCISSGYYQAKNDDSNVLDNAGFKTGLILIGTGSVFALLGAILN